MVSEWDSRMSLEEAAEIILKDEALDICAGCNGTGYMRYLGPFPNGALVFPPIKCSMCLGNVSSFKAEYIEACAVLGKDVPRLSEYVTVERMRKNPNYMMVGR